MLRNATKHSSIKAFLVALWGIHNLVATLEIPVATAWRKVVVVKLSPNDHPTISPVATR
jgi:hypothetical protein